MRRAGGTGRVHHPVRAALGLLAAGAVTFAAWLPRPASVPQSTGGPQAPASTGTSAPCQSNPLSVAYTATYAPTSPPRYYVTSATVRGLTPLCDGAVLSVTLLRAGQAPFSPAATGTVTYRLASGPSVAVPLGSTAPPASAVAAVHVTVDGGSLPVPSDCAGMTFTTTLAGTDDADQLTGSTKDDLIRGFGGNDTIAGLDGKDCVDGGEGNNDLTVRGGQDVVLADNGDNVVRAADNGSGTTVRLGAGNNSVALDGTATVTIAGHTGTGWRTVAGVGTGFATVVTSTGKLTLTVGAGRTYVQAGKDAATITTGAGDDVIEIGDGAATIRAGGGTNLVTLGNGKVSVVAFAGAQTTCRVPKKAVKGDDLSGCTTVVQT